jgi:VanZ family protein
MKSKNKSVVISWFFVGLWMILIFYFSSQVSETSGGLSQEIAKTIKNIMESSSTETVIDLKQLNHLLRKLAHFSVYFILGILVFNAMSRSGKKKISWMILMCVLYAISDEIHQSFVPGRGPSIIDVFIDSTGAITGIILGKVYLLKKKRINRST